jgi:hypothetical protein
MSNSTITFDAIIQSQSAKESTANAFFDAASPATLFGRRQSTTSGLVWGYYGGRILLDGVLTTVANGTHTLTASTTRFLEATRAGVVSSNATAFTPGSIPLYTLVVGASTVTSYTDERAWVLPFGIAGLLAKSMADANATLTAAEARNQVLQFTGTFTAARNIVLPLAPQQWTVYNNTTGGFGLQFIGATGTGITVAATKRATIYSDGTNIVRATPDT